MIILKGKNVINSVGALHYFKKEKILIIKLIQIIKI